MPLFSGAAIVLKSSLGGDNHNGISANLLTSTHREMHLASLGNDVLCVVWRPAFRIDKLLYRRAFSQFFG
jgi:hypothetical protein